VIRFTPRPLLTFGQETEAGWGHSQTGDGDKEKENLSDPNGDRTPVVHSLN